MATRYINQLSPEQKFWREVDAPPQAVAQGEDNGGYGIPQCKAHTSLRTETEFLMLN